MSLSIAWVTPYGGRSDISAFSRNVLLELSETLHAIGGSITLFVNENGASYWSPLPVVILSSVERDREALACFDLVFFNIGNNADNHRIINWLAIEIPGIVIVHDMVMQHFLAGEIFDHLHRKDLYARLIGEYYGEAGLARVAISQICSEPSRPIYAPWDTAHVTAMPLLEPFIATAAAVITHSAYAEHFVRAHFDGPVLRLALPWDQKSFLTERELADWQHQTRNRSNCLVVCFGYIGRAKCLDQVIMAFAESHVLRSCAHLTIAGYPGDRDYAAELQALSQSLGLDQVVEFEFAVSDQRLLTLKRHADVFVNLRYPNTESASGSMVEQMNAGKPVLIYPSGCFAEIDAGAAIRVEREDGAEGIAAALEMIARDPEARIRIGEAGRQYVQRTGRREYVELLLEFVRQHGGLLRQRQRCRVGQRLALHDLGPESLGKAWLTELTKTRRLFTELRSPVYEQPVSPFLTWDLPTLTSFVAVGLFGQAAGSKFEQACALLLQRERRPNAYRIIGDAHILWLACLGLHADQSIPYVVGAALLNAEIYRLLHALGDEILAKSLYLGLLGRVASAGEVMSYCRRLVSDPLEKIIREFLSSAEFKQRTVYRPAVDQLMTWCDMDHSLAAPCAELTVGDLISFSTDYPDSGRYLNSGWHPIEEGHVWSRDRVAALSFSIAAEYAEVPLSLQIAGCFGGTQHNGGRSLRVRCNREPELAAHINHDDWFIFELPITPDAGAPQNFLVFLDSGATVTMGAAGIGGDTRELGFCLQSICLQLGATAAY